MVFSSQLVVEDYRAALDLCYERSLTDGLPVVPPTPDLVETMLAQTNRKADECVGTIAGRPNGLSVEQAAVCAVMAGCLPHYFPIVLATWDAIFDPSFNAGAVLGSSAGTAITAVVSGSLAQGIGMNAEHNVFGPGNRANATIGRAIRLGVMNALGYRAGALDGAAFGSQARFTAHFAETPPPSPWQPLNVRLGYDRDATTVTVAVTDAPRQMTHIRSGCAENILRMLAAAMRDPTHCAAGRPSSYIIALGPEHADILVRAGLSQQDICEALTERSRISSEELSLGGVPLTLERTIAGDRTPGEDDRSVPLGRDGRFPSTSPDKIFLVTAGGTGAGWSHIIYGYAPSYVTAAVTKEVVAQ